MTSTPDQLRAKAAQHEQDAADSFERCDTDGFLSQWASGINAQKARLEADLAEHGNVATFYRYELRDLTGAPVRAKLIDGRYGPCWALLDPTGNTDDFTGEFITAHPKRRETMERKGYLEATVYFAAAAHVVLRGANATSVMPVVLPDDRDLVWHGREDLGDTVADILAAG